MCEYFVCVYIDVKMLPISAQNIYKKDTVYSF